MWSEVKKSLVEEIKTYAYEVLGAARDFVETGEVDSIALNIINKVDCFIEKLGDTDEGETRTGSS